MTAACLTYLLGVCRGLYGGERISDAQTMVGMATVWAELLGDTTDDEGTAAFKRHMATGARWPTPADILELVRSSRAAPGQRPAVCDRCGAKVAERDTWAELGDDDTYLGRYCATCHAQTHGGPTNLSLPAGLRLLRAVDDA